MRTLQRAGLAAAAVQDTEDVTRDAEHGWRHYLWEMAHPDLGVAEYAGPPYQFLKTPAAIRRITPPRRALRGDPRRVVRHAPGGKPGLHLASPGAAGTGSYRWMMTFSALVAAARPNVS